MKISQAGSNPSVSFKRETQRVACEHENVKLLNKSCVTHKVKPSSRTQHRKEKYAYVQSLTIVSRVR